MELLQHHSFLQSSVTKNFNLHGNYHIGSTNGFSSGTMVAGRVVRTSDRYGSLETSDHELRKLSTGDVIVGALGSRSALRGHTGQLPQALEIGDHLSLLNIGGVLGELSSSSEAVGKPVLIQTLGAIRDHNNTLVNLSRSPIEQSLFLSPLPPIIIVAGSCMHAGKTKASCTLIRYLKDQSVRTVALKLTGVGAQKDLDRMLSAGAVAAYSFVDAGLPSTCGVQVVPAAKGCLNKAATHNPEVIVVELGDGLLGSYGVLDILRDEHIRSAISTIVFSAADPLGAWGGVEFLSRHGLSVGMITGPCTDNLAGQHSISQFCHLNAINANRQPQAYGEAIYNMVFGKQQKQVGA